MLLLHVLWFASAADIIAVCCACCTWICLWVQTERMTQLVKQTDPSRLVCSASGWDDKPVGDIVDMHKYVGPGKYNHAHIRYAVVT